MSILARLSRVDRAIAIEPYLHSRPDTFDSSLRAQKDMFRTRSDCPRRRKADLQPFDHLLHLQGIGQIALVAQNEGRYPCELWTFEEREEFRLCALQGGHVGRVNDEAAEADRRIRGLRTGSSTIVLRIGTRTVLHWRHGRIASTWT